MILYWTATVCIILATFAIIQLAVLADQMAELKKEELQQKRKAYKLKLQYGSLRKHSGLGKKTSRP